MFCAPPAWAPWSFARKPRRLDHLVESICQSGAILRMNRGCKSHVIEQPFSIVEAEQQGTDQRLLFQIAKASDHTIGCTLRFNFLHASALSGLVGQIRALGNDSVEPHAHMEPLTRYRNLRRHRAKPNMPIASSILFRTTSQR